MVTLIARAPHRPPHAPRPRLPHTLMPQRQGAGEYTFAAKGTHLCLLLLLLLLLLTALELRALAEQLLDELHRKFNAR